MHEILIDILVGVVIIATTLVTKHLVPYIKAITHESKYAELMDIVEIAVKAAEQTINGSKKGKVKKADVVAFVSQWLAEKDIHITEDELNRLIEASVYAMNTEV